MSESTTVARDQLRSIVQRIERLEEEKKALTEDIRDVYAEAKANGFDTKALRAIVRLRKQDPKEREEHEAILATYMVALGMVQESFDFDGAPDAGPPTETETSKPTRRRRAGDSLKRKVGDSLKRAVAAMGEPTPLTEEEKAKGCTAAFVRPDGTRMSIAPGERA